MTPPTLMPRPLAVADTTGHERLAFYSTVEEDCILWTGALTAGGYGRLSVGNRRWYAHRLAYILFVEPVSDDLEVDHLCRVRNCINPDHLEPVTHTENILRGQSWTAVNARKTQCVNGHPFIEANLRLRGNERICRACERDANYRQVPCPDCGRSFMKSNLNKHRRAVHAGVPKDET